MGVNLTFLQEDFQNREIKQSSRILYGHPVLYDFAMRESLRNQQGDSSETFFQLIGRLFLMCLSNEREISQMKIDNCLSFRAQSRRSW